LPGFHIAHPTANDPQAYGCFPASDNRQFEAPSGGFPLQIVITHGGPTGSVKQALDLDVHFFTSGGFAVLGSKNGGSAG